MPNVHPERLPPEDIPEEEGLRWFWVRSGWSYAYEAIELVRKLKGELDRLQRDLGEQIGDGYDAERVNNETFQVLHNKLDRIETDVKGLLSLRDRMFGGWSVAKAIVTSSVVSTLLAVALNRLLK